MLSKKIQKLSSFNPGPGAYDPINLSLPESPKMSFCRSIR